MDRCRQWCVHNQNAFVNMSQAVLDVFVQVLESFEKSLEIEEIH